jgi:hypothetical protein
MAKRSTQPDSGGTAPASSGLQSQADKAAEHFAQFGDNLSRPYDSVHVTDDLQVFPGTAKGRNDCDNYCKAKNVTAQAFNFQTE